ncbi:MAG TPA: hypothetical protein VFN57_09335 [Thermomicrobiaceae bacterium]|nr:hypothetical protein [Thermomicrobiaceae bacterium]
MDSIAAGANGLVRTATQLPARVVASAVDAHGDDRDVADGRIRLEALEQGEAAVGLPLPEVEHQRVGPGGGNAGVDVG